ncbi:MAG: hypothetical protein JRJ37_01345 [Deltaproteobacteria bacterium]|nr:hypothetical protein [Deltaproteobacteria bacterium]MBW2328878.1 hypothetical protein [Deltaproteobacteria bacterium]
MQRNISHPFLIVVAFVSFVLALPVTGFADKTFGGITFIGEREDVCVLIEGECVQESIYFKLDTCDTDKNIKQEFKDRTPFTLLVPKGVHRMVIMKEGRKVVTEEITIVPEEVLEFKLP